MGSIKHGSPQVFAALDYSLDSTPSSTPDLSNSSSTLSKAPLLQSSHI
jgi:hypothetical protein